MLVLVDITKKKKNYWFHSHFLSPVYYKFTIIIFIITFMISCLNGHTLDLSFQHFNVIHPMRNINSHHLKFTGSIPLNVNGNSGDTDKQRRDNEENINQKPKYRSKLQRLNQVRGKSHYSKRSTMKPKFKSSSQSRMEKKSISSKVSSSTSLTQMPFGLLRDINIDEEHGIDSFLRGEFDFAADAATPLPQHTPQQIVEIALKSLRDLNRPTPNHGAAVFMRFCAPLSRQDRWGNTSGTISNWKAIMRGALTSSMLARRLRASEEFSVLLDWKQLDVTKGTKAVPNEMLGFESTVAFVHVALYFGDGTEPSMCQFTLKMFNGVWLIDSAVMNKREWFIDKD